MHNHQRSSSQSSSIKTDISSLSSSPSASTTYESPASLNSSPTFTSIDSFKYQGTGTSHHMSNLPQFSMANMQHLMRPQGMTRALASNKISRPWTKQRTLSQTALQIEAELNGSGIENLGLGLFEPRPRETTVSRHPSQGSVVLDGIMEVMQAGR